MSRPPASRLEPSSLAPATLCAHGGAPRSIDLGGGARAHVSPILQTTVFDFATIAESEPALGGDGYVYRRNGMPNADELGTAVALLEGAEAGQATSSGMGAVAAVAMGLLSSGARALVQRDAYGGTPAFLDELGCFGVDVLAVDVYDPAALEPALDGAAMLLVESIANPLLRRAPIEELSRRCRERGVTLVVDNTFATPLGEQPLSRGADLALHSATKFLGGHHDACAGVVVGDAARVERIATVCRRAGLIASPLDAWLTVRGIRTLEVRLQRAWQTAAELADRLDQHPAVARVHRAERCALVTFDVGSRAAAEAVVAACRLITLSPSLGGTTTTLSHPASSSHVALSAEARAAAGIGDGLLRMCVGLESPADLWRDLEPALFTAPRG